MLAFWVMMWWEAAAAAAIIIFQQGKQTKVQGIGGY
jgi:hypothetical protein